MQKLSLYGTFFLCFGAAAGSYAAALDERSQTLVPQSVGQTTFDDLHKEAKAYIIEHGFPELVRWLAFKVADQHRGEIPANKIPKNGSIVDMDINPDGKLVMTHQTGNDQPGELTVWDLKSKELIKKIELDFDPCYVRITPDGNKAIVKKGAGYLQTTLWDLNTAKKIMVLGDCGNRAMGVSPDGSFAIMAVNHYSTEDDISSWDLVKEAKKESFSCADKVYAQITCPSYLTISPDANKIAVTDLGSDLNSILRIRIIDLIAKDADALMQFADNLSVWGLQFVDARTVAIFVSNKQRTQAKIHIWDINSRDLIKTINCDHILGDNIRSADFFGDNLTYSYEPNSITVNNFMSGQCLDVHFPDFEGRGMTQVDKVILRHNWLVARMKSGHIYVWDLHNKELFEELGKLTWKQVHLLRWIYEYAIQGKKLLLKGESSASIKAICESKGMPDFIQRLVSDHVR